jgi:hypothetical protein
MIKIKFISENQPHKRAAAYEQKKLFYHGVGIGQWMRLPGGVGVEWNLIYAKL